MKRAFWTVFALMLAVYLVMVLWSLPRISAEAGGLTPFDLRPGGYSFEEAKAFVAALTPEGARFYRTVQHRLDIVYPALLAATLFLGIHLLSTRLLPALRLLLPLTALPGAWFDWQENAAVGRMLDAGADGLTAELAAEASSATVAKSLASSVAMTVLLVLLIAWAVRRVRRRRNGTA